MVMFIVITNFANFGEDPETKLSKDTLVRTKNGQTKHKDSVRWSGVESWDKPNF